MSVTEVVADDAALRVTRRQRVLAEMEAADIDLLVVGREANARYVSGAPRLWTAGSRAFGPGCVLVRATGAVHLLSTWDEGIPDDIPHENLYPISFNAMNFVTVLQGIEGAATARRVATDALTPGTAHLLPMAFPAAELVDGEPMLRRCRQVKTPDEVEAIGGAVQVTERALAVTEAALAPGTTERRLTGVFMEAMADVGVTTPGSQDVAWATSREQAWRGHGRDRAIEAGDLVAFDASVVVGGYAGELGRTYVAGGGEIDARLAGRFDDLWSRLLDALRPGAPLSDLLAAYETAGVAPPPMPIARGLGLGYDLPLVTHALPGTAADQDVEAGMVVALVGYVWEQGVGGLYGSEPVVVTATGAEALSAHPIRDTRSS
ncbi:MAG: aminopeptidase P family protein [Acidimicrobiia bacterium]|nr:aminopeptidase P family protein [Acidimicrobiia bacterium]